MVVKSVPVLEVEVCDVILEVPQMLVRERRGEVPHVVQVELVRQVPHTDCPGTVESDFPALTGACNASDNMLDSNPEIDSCSAVLNRDLTTLAGVLNAPDKKTDANPDIESCRREP